MKATVRPLVREDEASWRALWEGYLTFYETHLAEDITAETFRRLIEDSRFFARVAQAPEGLVGFAHCVFHPATWTKADYCYLEDLYVNQTARGVGVGRALIEAVYAEADRRGAARVYWMTHQNNATARRLYDKLATKTDFVQYRRT